MRIPIGTPSTIEIRVHTAMMAIVDMVSRHLSLRIVIIGEFLKGNPGADPLMAQYEAFVDRTRTMAGAGAAPTLNAFALQDTLIPGSTLAINAVVIAYGLLHNEPWIAAAGALGIIGSMLVERVYGQRIDAVRAIRIDGPPA